MEKSKPRQLRRGPGSGRNDLDMELNQHHGKVDLVTLAPVGLIPCGGRHNKLHTTSEIRIVLRPTFIISTVNKIQFRNLQIPTKGLYKIMVNSKVTDCLLI